MELDFFSLRNRKGFPSAFFLSLLLATAVSSPAQTFTTLASFNGANGYGPNTALVQSTDGSFYGTTQTGGASNYGTIFKITPSGTLTTLHSFVVGDGSYPNALVQATDGNFYGTAGRGGANGYGSPPLCPAGPGITGGCGTVFKITPSGTLTTIYNFCSVQNGSLCADGIWPHAGLVQGTDGNFYGTTSSNGANGAGTVFKITATGTLTTLYSFCAHGNASCTDGKDPEAALVQATDGNFYGTTFNGGVDCNGSGLGCGTVFKITPTGTLTTLYSFVGGTPWVYPYAGLVQAADGNFYGTTAGGGAHSAGMVFRITPGGSLTTLYNFCAQTGCADGGGPHAGLIQATDGNLYGTTGNTVFKITVGGTLTTLHSFPCAQTPCPDGTNLEAALAQGTDGNFYGTTSYGGPIYTGGTVFSLSVGLGPFVTTIPTSGAVGTAVTILGNNLTGATGVSFNGTAATFTVVSSSEIQTTVPAGATTGTVQVTTPSGTLNSNVRFTVVHEVLLDAPSAGSSYYGMYCSTCIAASFTFTASHYVSTIDVVLRTPATTSFTTFDFSLQNSLTAPITTFASEALKAPLGVVSTVEMNVNKTLSAGTYYLVGNIPGYFGTPVTPGDVDGWLLSTGVYNNAAGTVTNGEWAPNGSTWILESGVAPAFSVNGGPRVTRVPTADFDGDGKADVAVFRPSNGTWYVIPSNNPSNFLVQQWGVNNDIPVAGDYDGDGRTDFAVWRPSNGTWYVIPSSNPSNFLVQQWGMSGDIPVPGDYDGDGKTDFAVWRPSNGIWYVIPSSNPSNLLVQQWGVSTDIPVPVDYDGDGRTDIAVWRPSNGFWYIIPSSAPSTFTSTQWGASTDVPVQKPIGQ